MARVSQRFLGAAVFVGAIAFGMHVAGQTPMSTGAPGSDASGASGAAPVPISTSLPGATGVPKNPADARAQSAPMHPGAPTLPNPNGPVMPAFGGQAAKAADHFLNNAEEGLRPPPPTPTPKFVPSEVESVQPAIKVGDPRAVLHTSMGDITIRLYSGYAPKTVRNFVDLARGDREFTDVKTGKPTRRPFYTNLIFHRVIKNYLIQTGCPFGNGHGGPGYVFPDEFSPVLRFSKPGIVAMAPEIRGKDPAPDTNGSQFFIALQPMPDWDNKYTIFGEVERGMSVVDRIARSKVGPTDRPIKRVFLLSVDIIDEATASALGK